MARRVGHSLDSAATSSLVDCEMLTSTYAKLQVQVQLPHDLWLEQQHRADKGHVLQSAPGDTRASHSNIQGNLFTKGDAHMRLPLSLWMRLRALSSRLYQYDSFL